MSIDTPHINQQVAINLIIVDMPSGGKSMSTHTCDLNFPQLPMGAQQGHIFPSFPAGALISIGLLYDHGCTAHLNDRTITIVRHGTTILKGYRALSFPLWRINLSPPTFHQPHQLKNYAHIAQVLAQMAYTAVLCAPHVTIGQRIAFLHAALESPALSTLFQALNAGYLTSMPEITAALVRKYPLPSIAMIKGHLDQVFMNQRSTRTVQGTPLPPIPPSPPNIPSLPNLSPMPATPPSLPPIRSGAQTHNLFATYYSATGQVFTGQTEKFPTKSTASNTDMIILFDYDLNSIHIEPMPSLSRY